METSIPTRYKVSAKNAHLYMQGAKNAKPILDPVKVEFSKFSSKTVVTTSTSENLSKILSQLIEEDQSNRFKTLSEARTEFSKNGKSEEYKRLKDTLTGVTFGAIFNTRNKDKVKKYSGLACLDFDGMNPEDIPTVKDILKKDPYTCLSFVSPSGAGIKIIGVIGVVDSPEEYTKAYKAYEAHLKQKIKVSGVWDNTTDVTRLCYWSSDQSPVFSQEAYPFLDNNTLEDKTSLLSNNKNKGETIKTPIKANKNNSKSLFTVEERLNEALSNIDGVPAETYPEWLQVAFGLAHELGESGRTYFHSISSLYPDYNEKEANKQYDNCLKNNSGAVTIASVFKSLKESGGTYMIPKEDFKQQSANIVKGFNDQVRSDKPVTKSEAIKNVAKELNLSEKRVSEQIEFEGTSPAERLYNYLIKTYKPFFNTFDRNHYVTYQGKIESLSKSIFAAIHVDTKVKFEKASKELIKDCLLSANNPNINPIKSYIESHKDVKRNGELDEFTDCFNIVTGVDEDNFDPEFSKDMFKIWFASGVKMWTSEDNNFNTASQLMLCLYGAQGLGKDHNLFNCLPYELASRYVGNIAFKEKTKDLELAMTQNLMLIDSESRFNTESERQFLKDLISRPSFKIREMFTQNVPVIKRQALLASTSNESDLLNDPTGNRRIIPLHVIGIDWERINKINKTALLLDTYDYVLSGGKTKILGDDIIRLNNNTKAFQGVDLLQQFADNDFIKSSSHNTGSTLGDLIEKLSIKYPTQKNRLGPKKVKQALLNAGYTYKKVRIGDNTPYMINCNFKY